MLNHAELICFAATTRPEAAKNFYQNTLDLKLVEESPFALAFDVNGTMLRIQIVRELTPPNHTVLGWKVSDIRSAMTALHAKGVRFEKTAGKAFCDSLLRGEGGVRG